MCGDWGYKLPSEYDLTSLSKDIILGINISTEPYQRSYIPDLEKINIVPMKALNPDATPNSWGVALWEDKEESSISAYSRLIGYSNNLIRYTERLPVDRYPYTTSWLYGKAGHRAVCVYNPYGVAKTKYIPPQPKPNVAQQAVVDEKYNKEAENALF